MPRFRILILRFYLLLAFLLLPACMRRAPFDADEAYGQAVLLRRRGDLRQALALADRGVAQFGNSRESEWFWKFRLLKAEVLLTQGKAADASKLLDGPLPAFPETPEFRSRLLLDRGLAEFSLSKFASSKSLFDGSLEIAKAHQLWPLITEIEMRRGAALTRLGDAQSSEADFRDALRLARQQNDIYLEASILGNLGFLRMSTARYDEAISWYNQSMALFARFQSKTSTTRILNSLGYCYVQLGQPEHAIPRFQTAERLAAEIGELTDRHISLGRIGDWYQDRGEYDKATVYYQQAIDVARQAHSPYWTGKWLYQIAATALAMGDLSRAETYNRQSLVIEAEVDNPVERLWPRINEARIAELRHRPGEAESTYRTVIASAEKLASVKDPGLTLEARGRLANLLVSLHRDREGETEFRNALTLINTGQSEFDQAQYRISYFSSLVRYYQDYVDFLVAKHREIDALQVAESSRARVLAEKLGRIDRSGLGEKRYDYRRLARATGTILLSYWLAPRRSFLWVITPERIATFSLPPQVEIETMVNAYAERIQALRDPVPDGSAIGTKLDVILPASAQALIRPGSKIAIVPDGALHNLNFETLPAPGTPPRYWIEDVTIAVVPSLDLAFRAASRSPRAGGEALLIGDPVPADDQSFPRLSNAEPEITAIRRQFSHAVVRTREMAEPSAYAASNPKQFSIIHFAAHAEANRDDPLDSAIILSKRGDTFKLYARDVARVPIAANLVTLSACNSAGSRTYAGEGLVGFAWAFLQAGARDVVAGLWEVDDRSTAELMENLYSQVRQGKNPQQALRLAKLRLLRSRGSYRKPYYWAPFQVITDSLDR